MGRKSTSSDYNGVYLTKITLGDIAILIFVLGGSALSFFLLQGDLNKSAETYYVYQDNHLICKESLSRDTIFSVSGPRGKSVIQVKDGKIGVIKAPCPSKICKKTGMVQSSSKPIICIPNRLTIVIQTEGQEIEGITK